MKETRMSSAYFEVVNRSINPVFPNTNDNDVVIYPTSSNQSIHFGCASGSNSALIVNNSNVQVNTCVLQSAMPVCFVTHSTDFTILTGGTGAASNCVFNSVIVNRATAYNTSTGRFTAPVAGLYRFILRVGCMTLSVEYIIAVIKKNGSIISEGSGGAANTYMSSLCESIVPMAVGDYVSFTVYASANCTAQVLNNRTSFIGHLLC